MAEMPESTLNPIGTLFSDTWRLYKERLGPSLAILLAPAVVIALGSVIQGRGVFASFLGILLGLIGWIAFFVASLAIIFCIGRGTDFGESYRSALKIFWPFVWISVLSYFVVIGGFVMLIVPGIIMGVWIGFAKYVLVMEGKRGMNALVQSRDYLRGYFWAVLGRDLLLGIVFAVIILIIQLPVAFLFGPIGTAVASALWLLLLTPFSVAYVYKMYENLTALKPGVATSQATAGRGFLVASGIVGLVAPAIIIVAIIVVTGLGFFRPAP